MAPKRKRLILETSAALFRTKGYSATSMRDIADAVGMEAASLYNHIKSKNHILQIIVHQTTNICNDHLEYVLRLKDPREQLERVIRFHVKLMIQNYNFYYVMTHDWKNLDEPDLSNYVMHRRTYVQSLEKIVTVGTASNVFKKITPYVAILNILSAVMGLEFWHMSKKSIDEQTMEDEIVTHLLTGLMK